MSLRKGRFFIFKGGYGFMPRKEPIKVTAFYLLSSKIEGVCKDCTKRHHRVKCNTRKRNLWIGGKNTGEFCAPLCRLLTEEETALLQY
jgi:hypothetical protein